MGRTFKWLNLTQFSGALNDNIFRMLMVFYVTSDRIETEPGTALSIVQLLFVLPFLLFTPLAGKCADRFSKRNLIIGTKVSELLVISAGCAAFMLDSIFLLYAVLFLMSAQSAFFGPSKYGIVPELVERENLSKANGIIEGFTFFAIVTGMSAAAFMAGASDEGFAGISFVCIAIALVGLYFSFKIERTPSGEKSSEGWFVFVNSVVRTLWSIHRRKNLIFAVFGSAYFMFLAAMIQLLLIPYGMNILGFSNEHSGFLFLVAAVGIGLGSLLAGKLSGRSVVLKITPPAAAGLALSCGALAFIASVIPVFIFIFLAGICAGLFIVPVYAFIQLASPRRRRGQVLAASGFLGWIGVLCFAGIFYFCNSLCGMKPDEIFGLLSILTFLLSLIAYRLLD